MSGSASSIEPSSPFKEPSAPINVAGPVGLLAVSLLQSPLSQQASRLSPGSPLSSLPLASHHALQQLSDQPIRDVRISLRCVLTHGSGGSDVSVSIACAAQVATADSQPFVSVLLPTQAWTSGCSRSTVCEASSLFSFGLVLQEIPFVGKVVRHSDIWGPPFFAAFSALAQDKLRGYWWTPSTSRIARTSSTSSARTAVFKRPLSHLQCVAQPHLADKASGIEGFGWRLESDLAHLPPFFNLCGATAWIINVPSLVLRACVGCFVR
jgi:hypothetical protein